MLLPKKAFLTKGVGVSKHKLASFELALRDAKIAPFNIVRVSSIFPPNCKLVSREAGIKYLAPGQILYVVLAENSTNEPNRLIAASIGISLPKNPSICGYLSEHHPFGETEEKAGDYAEDLAASMLATVLGVKFDPAASYDANKELWKISHEIVKTTNITQSAEGDKHGDWTTVVAACVLII
ncbi:MAG: arginine decarboxylase, pyruvoyl-dependent [Candidatus Omnitrophica bacterium]|nr:arginine decarboxylase, pyruvoyl-dependent [Candidatus Omnitrophota bacterium]